MAAYRACPPHVCFKLLKYSNSTRADAQTAPEAKEVRVPVHVDVPEVLYDGGEVDPEHPVVRQLGGLKVVLDGPAAAAGAPWRDIPPHARKGEGA